MSVRYFGSGDHTSQITDLIVEVLAHTRPISLFINQAPFPALCVDNIDLSRLREFPGPLDCSGIVAQRASAVLETVTVTNVFTEDRFHFPDPSAIMRALTQLVLQEYLPFSVNSIPPDFLRFLGSCKTLSSLYVNAGDADVVGMIVKLCGKVLRALEILVPELDPSWRSSTSLAAYAPQLQVLRFEAICSFFLQPYPSTLQCLAFDYVILTTCHNILADLRASTKLPAGLVLRISLETEYEEELGEEEERLAEATITEIAEECESRGIIFKFSEGY